ncbi:MAG: DUF1338 domain-containing protein [Bacteroidetes bacterium]|nr:DUF1338 domain-containing protein [Bacteroidota bacterium]
MSKYKVLDDVLNGLMTRYKQRVPDVGRLLNLLIAKKIIASDKELENDHIAFRTLGVPLLGVQSLEKIFLHYGYTKKDYYFFPEKKLDAWWYAPPTEHHPRIFISELRVKELSDPAQAIIHSYTKSLSSDPVNNINLDNGHEVDQFLHSGLWRLPSWSDYEMLGKESEYAAWVIYNRYYLNHFTIAVHNLKTGYNTISSFNDFLEQNGFALNDSGGKIKVSPDGGLLQSSTVAQKVLATFAEGKEHLIPGSYVEFAERKLLPEYASLTQSEVKRKHRREGFEAGNADKIFESTYVSQTNKKS